MTPSPGQVHRTPEGAAGSPPPAAPTGGLAAVLGPRRTVGFRQSFPRETVLKIGVLAALLAALHARLLDVLGRTWIHDANWTHGFIIPLFSLYLLYARREELYEVRRGACLAGLAMMLLSLAAEVVAVLRVRNYWLAQIAMVGMLFGLVLYLGGGSVIRLTWLPILFLVFAMPIPELLYSRVAVPLQNLSAKGAVLVLRVLQVHIVSTASQLQLTSRSGATQMLTVAEACSGMRLLMAFLALGVAMAYLDYKPLWQRAVLVAAAIPIAIFCNVIRVAITCWMYYLDQPELGQDFMHYFTGVLMLVPAFLLLWLLAWILRNIFVEEPEEPASPQAEAPS